MRYAIISDVHGNATALRRVLADAAAQGVEEIVCLGDTLGYGPEPAKALRMVRESCTIVLAGNHDDAVAGRVDAGDFIDLAQDAALRHREELTGEDIDYLKALPYTCRGDGFAAVHGDFTDPKAFNYVDCESVAAGNFAAMSEQLMFVGHTHEPRLALMGSSGTVYMTGPQDFSLEEGKRYIVNPGSVGYPRAADGKCMSSYVIFDSSSRSVFFRFIPFTVDSMLQRGRPHRLRARHQPAPLQTVGHEPGGNGKQDEGQGERGLQQASLARACAEQQYGDDRRGGQRHLLGRLRREIGPGQPVESRRQSVLSR
jgi:predicted phosphodiesterase